MTILVFAGLAEVLGTRTVEWPSSDAPIDTVAALERALRDAHPAIASARFRVAVNQRYARADDPVADADEVALIPPVSGG